MILEEGAEGVCIGPVVFGVVLWDEGPRRLTPRWPRPGCVCKGSIAGVHPILLPSHRPHLLACWPYPCPGPCSRLSPRPPPARSRMFD